MGFDQLYAATIAPGQAAGDLERRAFAEIIDIRLEGQAQAGNLSARHAVDHPRRIFKNMIDLCVIHFTSGTDETRVLRVAMRSEEHTSELQSLMRISYAVFCLKKKINTQLQSITRSTKN